MMAEGLGNDDMGEGDFEEHGNEFQDKFNDPVGTLDQGEQEDLVASAAQSQKPKRVTNSYPTWFKDLLTSILAQLKEDRASITGQSRLKVAGTFWFPIKSIWYILQKPHICPTDLFVPQFFVWDPESFLPKNTGIGCPECNEKLHRNGVLNRPRRIVDIDCSFWIIGYNYRCRSCQKSFQSWDHRILVKLPPALAAEFPAHLTWRSGLSLRALGILRSCIQNGMGAHQVAAMFRVQHLLRYDELHHQYLQTIVSQLDRPGQRYEPFLPFDDTSDKGFHGFVPSGQWLRDVYDSLIESHKNSFNQHTAMLTGRICAIDHSHKLAKHIVKVDGTPIFTALLTVTNDKGEIRVCNFVATKSHSQFTDSLKRMRESLELYGHEQPQVFYTDNMADKAMLEECFPSLLESVNPVEKYSQLPLFKIPAEVSVHTLDLSSAMDNALQAIMSDLPVLGGYLVVGFDSEWNVDVSGDGRVRGRGPTAVIQIALQDKILILKIGEQLASRNLPQQLLMFLRESRILKAGRGVNGDLRHLETVSGQGPFSGGLELGAFAKQRFLISDARMSLSDLTAAILGQCLPKNRSERIS
ncbi:hypothetical protein BT96DRAFT_883255, partial [Gymnopus androsaceus JB14]